MPERLTALERTFEGAGVGGWTALNPTHSLSNVATTAHGGTHSLQVLVVGTPNTVAATHQLSVQAGTPWSVSGWVSGDTPADYDASIAVEFYTGFGSLVDVFETYAPNALNAGWQFITNAQTVPAGAATAIVRLYTRRFLVPGVSLINMAGGEHFWWDDLSFDAYPPGEVPFIGEFGLVGLIP